MVRRFGCSPPVNEKRLDGSIPKPAKDGSTGPEAAVLLAVTAGERTIDFPTLCAREREEKVVAKHMIHDLVCGNMRATAWAGGFTKSAATVKKEATARAERRRGWELLQVAERPLVTGMVFWTVGT